MSSPSDVRDDTSAFVVAWPRISATVRDDATGTLTVTGTEHPCRATSVDALRTGIIARCVLIARRLGRPVRLVVDEDSTSWSLAVRPSGVVHTLGEDGTIGPQGDLLPQEGPCRACGVAQPVTATSCARCSVDEPHRIGDLAVAIDEAVAANPSSQAPTAGRTPLLHLTFNTQGPVTVAGGVAVGRRPLAVGGRTPVEVASPGRLLSRTHVLIDIDAHGRIKVTDNHSGNGTIVELDRPTPCPPGVPRVVPAGATLVLGDVRCAITTAT